MRALIGRSAVAGLLAGCGLVLALMLPALGCEEGDGDASPLSTDTTHLSTDTTYVPTTDAFAMMDEAVRGLDWGNIAFDAPDAMEYEEVRTVALVLSPTLSVSALQSQLEGQVDVESAQVQISNRMEAKLSGIGFTIEALNPDLQAVTTQQVTRWEWEVSPTESGPQELHLSLSAYIGVAGDDAPLVVRTFDRAIDVNVTVGQRVGGFLKANWTWLWVAVVVPLAGFVWTRWRKRRGRIENGVAPVDAGDGPA